MNRRRLEFQAIDLATWPTVAYTEFEHEERRTFEARMQALFRYARGESLKQSNSLPVSIDASCIVGLNGPSRHIRTDGRLDSAHWSATYGSPSMFV
ncbi:hypothetical protein [Paraburkholderia dipogonis]|jgi:hypothetical protein|uniref:hypothetical protein n=1 Tax=Paraburkholderia dipogonis TaxID=1211383 RepID=UPI0038B96E0C